MPTTKAQGCPPAGPFVITAEYHRFEEFCRACLRDRYIGVCYGPPGVGKTLAARQYAHWDLVTAHDPFDFRTLIPAGLATCRTLLYTPSVTNTPRAVTAALALGSLQLKGLVGRAGLTAEETAAITSTDGCDLILVDAADRLTMPSLEAVRDRYDREGFGLILLGMPGFEKRLARYPQLYSRIGFAHAFRPLSPEAMTELLQHHWTQLGTDLDTIACPDAATVAAIIRITAGNFRLLNRLVAQSRRLLQLNGFATLTPEVVEAARECLVIGVA